jgi:uncharacterized glyoxalase superfamily protein PhnB
MSPFEAIGVISSDLPRSVAFYRSLGLDLPEDADGHVEAELPGGMRFMLDDVATIKSFEPEWEPPSGGHRIALAFRCRSANEVDALHRELVAAGYASHKEPWDAFWGMRYAQIEDPDGNVVDLFADLGS